MVIKCKDVVRDIPLVVSAGYHQVLGGTQNRGSTDNNTGRIRHGRREIRLPHGTWWTGSTSWGVTCRVWHTCRWRSRAATWSNGPPQRRSRRIDAGRLLGDTLTLATNVIRQVVLDHGVEAFANLQNGIRIVHQ